MDLVRITHNNEKLPKLLASDMPGLVLPLFASYEEVKRDNLYKINAEVVIFYVDYLKQMPFMFIEDYNKYDEG